MRVQRSASSCAGVCIVLLDCRHALAVPNFTRQFFARSRQRCASDSSSAAGKRLWSDGVVADAVWRSWSVLQGAGGDGGRRSDGLGTPTAALRVLLSRIASRRSVRRSTSVAVVRSGRALLLDASGASVAFATDRLLARGFVMLASSTTPRPATVGARRLRCVSSVWLDDMLQLGAYSAPRRLDVSNVWFGSVSRPAYRSTGRRLCIFSVWFGGAWYLAASND